MYLPFSLTRRYPANVRPTRGAWRTLLAALTIASSGAALAAPGSDRFERLREQDLRVAAVAYRLAVANQVSCRLVLTPQLGFVLHGIAQYQPADRDAAARSFGLGRNIGVMAVVGGSPAQQAGLMAGDQLLSVNGLSLAKSTADGEPSRTSVDRVQSVLIKAMRRGPVTVRVASSSGERDVTFAGDLGCPSDVELVTGDDINAWADGSRVLVSEGLLRRCATDDDLALVIAHEMAHNLLHHRERLAAIGVSVSGLLPSNDTASADIRETEEEADRLAVTLASKAGYDLSGAENLIGGLMRDSVAVARTHPDLSRRLSLLRLAIADARWRAGTPVAQRTGSAKTAASGRVSGRI